MTDEQYELDFDAEVAAVLTAADVAEESTDFEYIEDLTPDVNFGDDEYASN